MIGKQTVLSRIELNADDSVGVLFKKQLVEDGNILMEENHRALFPVGTNVPATLELISDHLEAMGYPRISDSEKAKILSACNL